MIVYIKLAKEINLFKYILLSLILGSSSLTIASSNHLELTEKGIFKIKNSQLVQMSSDEQSKIELTLVIDEKSKWNSQAIIDSHLDRVTMTLQSCALSLKSVEVITVEIDESKYNEITKARNSFKNNYPEVAFFDKQTRFSGPTIFLLKERAFFKKRAFAVSESSITRARNFLKQDWENLHNTMWVTESFESYQSAGNATKTYSVISHELVHNLGVDSHINSPYNIMSNSDKANSKNHEIAPEQCELIKKKQISLE